MHTLMEKLTQSVGDGFHCYLTRSNIDDHEKISYTTYGILVTNPGGEKLLEFPDISTDRTFVERFINSITWDNVSPIHIADLLEDYLE